MKQKFFLFLMLCTFNAEAIENEYVEFETGACFVFIQEDVKHNVFSIISDSESLVKHDGSYCYIDDKTIKKYTSENAVETRIPVKHCKDLPPNEHITKKLNPVKKKQIFVPDDTNKKSFSIPENLPEDIGYFLGYYGDTTNKTEDSNLSFSFNSNQIDLQISGEGHSSRRTCGGVPFNIINLKINNIEFFNNLNTDGCNHESTYIDKIDLDFKNKIIILHRNYDEKLTFHIPFKYFQDNGSISVLDNEKIKEIIAYKDRK